MHKIAQEERWIKRWEDAVHAIESGDAEGAIYMLKALARDGITQAMAEIGVIYETGLGPIKEDMDKAIEWYTKAADAGDVEGMLAIARLHLTGIGLPVDYTVARQHYEDIINEFENRRALFGLGWIYHKGLGVPVDLNKAESFYKRSYEAGHLLAPKWLANLYKARGQYLKAFKHWALAIANIWRTTFRNAKDIRLHRQL